MAKNRVTFRRTFIFDRGRLNMVKYFLHPAES